MRVPLDILDLISMLIGAALATIFVLAVLWLITGV